MWESLREHVIDEIRERMTARFEKDMNSRMMRIFEDKDDAALTYLIRGTDCFVLDKRVANPESTRLSDPDELIEHAAHVLGGCL